MSVPKSRRKQSRFEAQHHFYKLRQEVTALILNDFGFREDKYLEALARYRELHADAPDTDGIVERWAAKNESFRRWFIDSEAQAILEILRNIERSFTMGNSIFPSETPARLFEFVERRHHIDAAIGYCYTLKQELQYVIRTLPVDLNKYDRFAEAIDKQIALYKGVRQSDNRLIKPKKPSRFDDDVRRVFDGLASLLHRASEIQAGEK